jgi:putative ABC transport system substrate-binding protein
MRFDPVRREFLALAGAAAACRLAHAEPALPEIGILNSISFGPISDRLDAFFEGLADTKFFEGRNVTVVYHSAEGRADLLLPMAADLVRRNPQVIVCLTGAGAVRAAMTATQTIPIVFAISGDPVEFGLVADPKHPEANVTGAGRVTEALNPDRLKVLCELLPPAKPVAFLFNSAHLRADAARASVRQMQAAAEGDARELVTLDLAGNPELADVFAHMSERGVAGFVIAIEALFNVWRDQVIGLSAAHSIAAMFPNREYVQAGGLVSYGADLYEHYRVAGTYTGRILKGEKPADMPVVIPAKFEMVVNLKTARALGLDIPQSFLAKATEVVE